MPQPLIATAWPRHGVDPGPRVRPRRDRWGVPLADVTQARLTGLGLALVPGSPTEGPRVLITMDTDPDEGVAFVYDDDVRALHAAGAVPVLVPPGDLDAAVVLAQGSALVLTGGPTDVHPSLYGEDVQGRLDRIDPERTGMELALARAAIAADLPTLGICGGMQLLAVACGGTLIQDLPTHPTHEQPTDPAEPWHDVFVEGPLAAVLGARTRVNSTHHQAVRDPGALAVAARSPEGVVEAVWHPTRTFVVGVQWHPERLGDSRLHAALLAVTAGSKDHQTSAG